MNINFKTDTGKNIESIDQSFDREWVKSTFSLKDSEIIIGDEYSKWIRKNRYYSTADHKFTCTSPGMSMAVNPKPQFTRYCDIRSKGKLKNRPDITVDTRGHQYGLGMGRYYSEAIDDNQQRIYLRFGVPKYIPLLLWIYKSFDVNKVVLQNRGVITSTLLETIGVISKFFAIAAAPLLALGMFAANVITQSSRFYSVKDTMYVYWATVENILNQMVARRTMIPYVLQDYTIKIDPSLNREQKPNAKFVQELNSLLPDIIDGETGRISVFAIALRSQAAFNRMRTEDYEKNKQQSLSSDFTGYRETGNTSHDTYFTNRKGQANVSTKAYHVISDAGSAVESGVKSTVENVVIKPYRFTENLLTSAYKYLMKDDKANNADALTDTEGKVNQKSLIDFEPSVMDANGEILNISQDPNNPNDPSIEQKITNNVQSQKDKWGKYKEYLMGELTEGGAFAVFNVDNTGSIGESFSNSFGSNPIESMFNSAASKLRNMGDILSSAASIPIIGDTLKIAADTGATILSNASFGIANPLLALAYGVNISMPKVWESSSATLPRASYKFKLISPYGNAYSQLFNIYMPLAMVLAGSLPRSTGSTTHTYPFFCQLFDRGRTNIQLGMIESVSLTRGTSNLAFARSGHPNAIDVDIQIANLDEIISVDVNSSGVIGKALDALSPDFSDNPFTSYLNSITAVDVYTQIYKVPLIRLKLAERYSTLKAVVNPDPAAFAAMTVNTLPLTGIVKAVLGENAQALHDITQR